MSWNIDPAHSRVFFTAKHMMITTVTGEFEKFSGTIEYDEENPAATTVDVKLDVDSLHTREPKRDGHLKSADFLDVENYPHILFKSNRVEQIDDSHGKLIGDLSIRGTTREVSLDVEFTGGGKSPYGMSVIGFNANGKLLRKEWDLTWNVALETGGFLVSEEVGIHIEVQLVKQEEPEKTKA